MKVYGRNVRIQLIRKEKSIYKSTMKIAFLVLNFPVLSETFILNQIAGLIDRGHEVHIHPLAPPRKEYFSKVHPIVEQYNLLDRTH